MRSSIRSANTNLVLAGIASFAVAGFTYADTGHSRLHDIEHFFEDAIVITGPELVDCKLSGGTESQCFRVVVKPEPSSYTPGPWCPQNISDGADSGGIWLEGGEVYDVDGNFLEQMKSFYDDGKWQLYNPDNGEVYITDTMESCAAAARPNVDPRYQNHCVECLPEYMGEDVAITFTIPLEPVVGSGRTFSIRQSGAGIARNGVRLDAPAPVADILGNYTLAPFDDCGGHVNLHVGYHYHAVTGCVPVALHDDSMDGSVVGIAMDGHLILTRTNNDGVVATNLDECGGHSVDGGDYHYHAGEAGSNAILNCLIAEAGCVAEGATDAACDATARRRGPPPKD